MSLNLVIKILICLSVVQSKMHNTIEELSHAVPFFAPVEFELTVQRKKHICKQKRVKFNDGKHKKIALAKDIQMEKKKSTNFK